jgi:cytoskeletal protein CcmA (bactofilin family)
MVIPRAIDNHFGIEPMSWFKNEIKNEIKKETREEPVMAINEPIISRGAGEDLTYMGKNVTITGTVQFEGSGRIDGKVDGKISVKGTLTLGEGAQISNEVEGDTVIVGGKVTGSIVARKKVQLLKTAVVDASINSPTIAIEEGSQFNGSCSMSSAAPKKAATPPQFVPSEAPQGDRRPAAQV